jgi:hypothetical protein
MYRRWRREDCYCRYNDGRQREQQAPEAISYTRANHEKPRTLLANHDDRDSVALVPRYAMNVHWRGRARVGALVALIGTAGYVTNRGSFTIARHESRVVERDKTR